MNLRIWLFLGLSAATGQICAYVLSGHSWPQPEATFVYDIVNTRGETTSPSGMPWNDAFEEAMRRWNEHTGFTFVGQPGVTADPCRDDNRNTIGFRRDDCGFAFGATTLAITYSLFSRNNRLQETDIVFNDNEAWDTYAGPLRSRVTDFTRVATHELGHALGLDHEDRVPSIMSSLVGDLSLPQKDDIDGVNALYGERQTLPGPCQNLSPLFLNFWIQGRLEAADCRRSDIADDVFASDDSAVDLHFLDLPASGLVVVRMQSEQLDPYLELWDAGGTTLLAADDDSGAGTDALIVVRLAAGRYQLRANSAFRVLQEGIYRLQVGINLDRPSPARLETDGSVSIDSVDVNGVSYWARLIPYANPDDPQGRYWRLETYGIQAGEPAPGAILLPESTDLVLNPVEALGSRYDAILKRHSDPGQPAGWFWRLDSATRRE